jgi:hypothetical protein
MQQSLTQHEIIVHITLGCIIPPAIGLSGGWFCLRHFHNRKARFWKLFVPTLLLFVCALAILALDIIVFKISQQEQNMQKKVMLQGRISLAQSSVQYFLLAFGLSFDV